MLGHRTAALALLIWLLTPGSESVVLTDAAWAICEVTAGDDAWRCEDEWSKQGSAAARFSKIVGELKHTELVPSSKGHV